MISTTQDRLESDVGGSFIDDLLGIVGHELENEIVWREDVSHVEAFVCGETWSRLKFFTDGEYEEEWHKIK